MPCVTRSCDFPQIQGSKQMLGFLHPSAGLLESVGDKLRFTKSDDAEYKFQPEAGNLQPFIREVGEVASTPPISRHRVSQGMIRIP